MYFVLVYGYLFGGFGFNVYIVNIVKLWKQQGYVVMVVCQDFRVDCFDFVDEFFFGIEKILFFVFKGGCL